MRHRALSMVLGLGLLLGCPPSPGEEEPAEPAGPGGGDPAPADEPPAEESPASPPEESPVPSPDPALEQVEEWSGWGDAVRARSDRLERRIVDGIGSPKAAAQARRDLVALRTALDQRLEELEAAAADPALRGDESVQAYRATLIEYLEWRRTTGHGRLLRWLDTAEDEEVGRSARARIVLEETAAAAEEDAAWAERLEAAAAAVEGGALEGE